MNTASIWKLISGETAFAPGSTPVGGGDAPLDMNDCYERVSRFPMFHARVTPSSHLDHVLGILGRRGIQVHVSPEEANLDERYLWDLGLTVEHTDKAPLIWLNLSQHGYAAGGTPNEDRLINTLVHEAVHAMAVLLNHRIPVADASPRELDLGKIATHHGASLLLEGMGLYIHAGKNRAVAWFHSRRVNDEAAAATAKMLGEEAASHFVGTPEEPIQDVPDARCDG